MLNKQVLLLPQKDPGLRNSARFAEFMEGSQGAEALFATQIVDENSWERMIDLLLLYQASNQVARRNARDPRRDWVSEECAKHLKLDSIHVERSTSISQAGTLFSIVIPFRDREDTLRLVLKSIGQLVSHRFELILVDDGSKTPFSNELRQALANTCPDWALLTLPPTTIFRAGFARNVGALAAHGQNLVFLDSDILVRANFLEILAQEMREHDLVQSCRWQVWRDDWADGARELDEPNDYWRHFQQSPTPWSELREPWRYVSSYSLAVQRQRFLDLGGFRHWYTDYGFEDTDLGLRGWRQGWRLHRSANQVFHLAPMNRRAWLDVLRSKRNSTMRRSARKFLLINQAFEALPWIAHML